MIPAKTVEKSRLFGDNVGMAGYKNMEAVPVCRMSLKGWGRCCILESAAFIEGLKVMSGQSSDIEGTKRFPTTAKSCPKLLEPF